MIVLAIYTKKKSAHDNDSQKEDLSTAEIKYLRSQRKFEEKEEIKND